MNPGRPGARTAGSARRPFAPAFLLLGFLLTLLIASAPGLSQVPRASSWSDPADCAAPQVCLAVSFNLSSPGGGELTVTDAAGNPIDQNFAANVTLSLTQGQYNLSLVPTRGYSFNGWVPDGEITVENPRSEATWVTVTSSQSGVEALVSLNTSPAPSLLSMAWFWAFLAAAGAAVVLGLLLWRSRGAPARGTADGRGPTATSGAAAPGTETVDLGRWDQNALTLWEGANEDELWRSVKASRLPPGKLLCFTYGRTERLPRRYGLEGCRGVRITRLEPKPGDSHVGPTELDAMADLVEKHLGQGEGFGVVIPGLEALILASGTRNVVRLVEVGRDLALNHKGSLLATVNPAAVTSADMALLERGAHLLRP